MRHSKSADGTSSYARRNEKTRPVPRAARIDARWLPSFRSDTIMPGKLQRKLTHLNRSITMSFLRLVTAFGNQLLMVRRVHSIALLLLLASPARCHSQITATTAAQLDRAARFIDTGDWQKAEETLRAMLRAHPGQADALNLLGIPEEKQGRAEEAETLFRKALRSNPSLAAVWVNLARLRQDRGDSERALRTLEEGLSHAPQDPRLLSEAAILLADRGDFAE